MNSWYGSPNELSVETARRFVIDTISIVLDGHSLVLLLDSHLLNPILFHEFEKGSVTEHLGNFQLMLVPVLQEARLYITNVHIKDLPVGFGACFADERAKGHIEMCGLLLPAVDAIGIKGIFDEKCLYQLSLLSERPLDMRFGRWLRDEV